MWGVFAGCHIWTHIQMSDFHCIRKHIIPSVKSLFKQNISPKIFSRSAKKKSSKMKDLMNEKWIMNEKQCTGIIMSEIKKNRWETAGQIASDINMNYQIQLNAQTIENRTNEHGYRGRGTWHNPFISLKDKKKQEHVQKSSSFWRTVLSFRRIQILTWTDLMVELHRAQGCVSYSGVGDLVFTDSITDG